MGCGVTLEDFEASRNAVLLTRCRLLCREVFCQEYGLEKLLGIDEDDGNTRQILARSIDDNLVVATCRLRFIQPYVRMEQVAVRKVCFVFGIFNFKMSLLYL